MNNVELKTILKVPDPAVIVRDAYKRYSPDLVVLRGFNMTVPKGIIYGLLGPSGCGKTTLFRCIVGQGKLDHGSIQLNIDKRSRIGYMPQSISLHTQLTVFENIFFYAYMFGSCGENARYQALKLIELLELPSGDRLLSELSGGQQRRVSIAITCIHDPDIYILDEPTVGLDPIIAESIWKWFVQLTNRGKTIIITTHYIQEAHHAHKIGLMRNGILLTESAPNRLTLELQTDTLEKAFLLLSAKQENSSTDKDLQQIEYPEEKPFQVQFKSEPGKFMDRFKSLIYKNTNLMKRDYKLTLFIIFLPTIVVWMSQYTLGHKPTNLPLAVVNDETTFYDCATHNFNECFLNENSSFRISCLYMEHLRQKAYITLNYMDKEAAQRDIHNRNVRALIHFPKNYTQFFVNRINKWQDADELDLNSSSLAAWIDLSNPFIGTVLEYDLAITLQTMLKSILSKCDINLNVGNVPIKYEKPIHGNFDDDFSVYVINVMMCLSTFASPALYGLLLLYSERSAGVYERVKATGVSMFEILSAGLLVLMIIYSIQASLIFVVVYRICDIPLEGSFTAIVTLFALHGVVGILFGFMLGFMFDDLVVGTFTAGGSLIALALVSGIAWPMETQHVALKSVQWFFVGVKFIEGVRGINMKGIPLTHHLVLNGIFWEIFWIVGYVIIIYIYIRLGK